MCWTVSSCVRDPYPEKSVVALLCELDIVTDNIAAAFNSVSGFNAQQKIFKKSEKKWRVKQKGQKNQYGINNRSFLFTHAIKPS